MFEDNALDYVIARHFPELADAPDKYPRFLNEVVTRTARLMAKWQAVGFAHGVMNTDNMSILGLTFDYGPFGFMDAYNPGYVCNHSDHGGRYAFDRQPQIGLWNLTCLAQALTPLIPVEEARAVLGSYGPTFAEHYVDLMSQKLGLTRAGKEDVALIEALLYFGGRIGVQVQREHVLAALHQAIDVDDVGANENPLAVHRRLVRHV